MHKEEVITLNTPNNRLVGRLSKISIPLVIDGCRKGIREMLKASTIDMGCRVTRLLSENLRLT